MWNIYDILDKFNIHHDSMYSLVFFDKIMFEEEFNEYEIIIDENNEKIYYFYFRTDSSFSELKLHYRAEPMLVYSKRDKYDLILKEYDDQANPIIQIKNILKNNNITLELSDWVNNTYIRDYNYKFIKKYDDKEGRLIYFFKGYDNQDVEFQIRVCPTFKQSTVSINSVPQTEDEWLYLEVIPWSPEYDDGIVYN